VSKRGNSEGSISKRTDKRWMARLTLPDGRRKAFYARTRQERPRSSYMRRKPSLTAYPWQGSGRLRGISLSPG